MERIFAISFGIIDNNITSEGSVLLIHEMGRNPSHSPSILLSQAPLCKAKRQHLSYTFCRPRAVFPNPGGHNTGARDRGVSRNGSLHASFPKHLYHWAKLHSTEGIKGTWELAPSSSSPSSRSAPSKEGYHQSDAQKIPADSRPHFLAACWPPYTSGAGKGSETAGSHVHIQQLWKAPQL